ncbi:MAG TPA: glycosyltransferase family A protein [Puia sp.]|nr:glycosyltransferase family A protein [Puia sp.]
MISICIPAYKRADLLKRLLDSIAIQTWKDFEVIVTDDSPDDTVRTVCRHYEGLFPLNYYLNDPALGTPENWNEAIRNSKGRWIKIMHDDDWFAGSESLEAFVRAISSHPEVSFFSSAYRNSFPDGRTRNILVGPFRYRAILKRPAILFAGNCIGPPSCTLFEKKEGLFFENRFKWLVDIDFYIRYLQSGNAFCIKEPLINIGISDTQVTMDSWRNRSVEIPENFLLLERVGVAQLKNLRIFDYWWRLFRNLRITDLKDIRDAGFNGPMPSRISAMVRFQKRIPAALLTFGPVSKLLMLVCYFTTRLTKDSD